MKLNWLLSHAGHSKYFRKILNASRTSNFWVHRPRINAGLRHYRRFCCCCCTLSEKEFIAMFSFFQTWLMYCDFIKRSNDYKTFSLLRDAYSSWHPQILKFGLTTTIDWVDVGCCQRPTYQLYRSSQQRAPNENSSIIRLLRIANCASRQNINHPGDRPSWQ